MSERWKDSGVDSPDPLGRDVALAAALEAIDPESTDPNYWLRFRAWVLRSAAAELARRRLIAELTVGDVMTSWARAVVPTAALAAALASLMLMRGEPVPAQPLLSVEEILLADLEGPTIPAALGLSEAGSAVAFAEDTF